MNKLEILKGGAELVVSIGVSSIVGNAIKMTTDPTAGRFKKIAIGIGGFVLSNMIGEMATEHTNKKIDTMADRIEKIVHPEENAVFDFGDNVHVIIEANPELDSDEVADRIMHKHKETDK